jgi:hypothetical protein
MNLITIEAIEIVGEQKGHTTKLVAQPVELGKARGILATCAHTMRRRSKLGIPVLACLRLCLR